MSARRIWIAALLVCALALSISAQGMAAEKKRLLWATCCAQVDRHQLFQEIAADYMAANPDIEIEWVYPTGGGYQDILKTWIAGGVAADVFWIGGAFWEFVDLTLPLDRLVAEDPGIAGIHPAMLRENQWEGEQLGLMYGANSHPIAYNKTLFDEAGLQYPTPAWTWDDALDMARRLTRDSSGDGEPAIWGLRITEFQHIFNYGGDFYTPDNRAARIANDVTIAAAQLHADMYSGKIQGALPNGVSAGFEAQQLAMQNIGIFNVPGFRQNVTAEWDVVPFPGFVHQGEQYHSTFVSGEAWSVYKDTPYPDEAIAFVRYLFGEDVMAKIARSGIVIPTQTDIGRRYFIDPSLPPANMQAFLDSLAYGHQRQQSHPIGREVHSLVAGEWGRLWNGEVPAATIIPEWQRRINALLDAYFAGAQ